MKARDYIVNSLSEYDVTTTYGNRILKVADNNSDNSVEVIFYNINGMREVRLTDSKYRQYMCLKIDDAAVKKQMKRIVKHIIVMIEDW